MKKLGFALMGLLMISSTGAFAQTSFGVKAGVNFSNMTVKYGGDKQDDNKFKPGFTIGAFADIAFSDMIGLETGLNIETKGYKIKNDGEDFGVKYKSRMSTNLIYATIPVDVKLTFGNIYVLAGPYLGIAATGKTKSKFESNGHEDKHNESLKFGNDKDDSDLKRMDLGLGLGVGYEINENLGVRLGYDLGMSNLIIEGDKDNSAKNGVVSVAATFKF